MNEVHQSLQRLFPKRSARDLMPLWSASLKTTRKLKGRLERHGKTGEVLNRLTALEHRLKALAPALRNARPSDTLPDVSRELLGGEGPEVGVPWAWGAASLVVSLIGASAELLGLSKEEATQISSEHWSELNRTLAKVQPAHVSPAGIADKVFDRFRPYIWGTVALLVFRQIWQLRCRKKNEEMVVIL